MKVTYSEMLSKKKWFHKELMASLDGDTIFDNGEKQYLDVKLLINGKTFNPDFLEDLYQNIESYIEHEAKLYIKEKLDDAEDVASHLLETINECKTNIIDKFEL